MDPKKRNIIIGAVLGVLVLVVIYINFFAGSGTPSIEGDTDNALQTASDSGSQPPADVPAPSAESTIIKSSGGGGGGAVRVNP